MRSLEAPVTTRVTGSTVWLIGPARSGTSLLYKLLCLHPEASYVSNYVSRWPSVPQLAALNRLARHARALQRRVWFGDEGSNAYVYGDRRALTDRLVPMPVEGEPVFRAAGVGPGPAIAGDPQTTIRRLRSAVAAIRSAAGGSIFVNKRIANLYRIPILAEAFPRARWVVLVRDGRAVAASLSKVDWWPTSIVPWQGGTPDAWARSGRDPWELCARNWVEELRAMEAGLDPVPPEQVLRLRYEDLIAAPTERLGEVAAFAGLPPSEEWHRRVAAVRFPDRRETWRTTIPPEALGTVEEIQGTTLEAYGYAR
jgi:hypothetical protein